MTTKLASFTIDGRAAYGAITDDGVVDLSLRFGARWPTLKQVIEADALGELVAAAAAMKPDYPASEITYEIPIPQPEKIICVGVNFPDRNAEYKDGQEAPPNPSLFIRFPRSFTGHDRPLIRPPESEQLDYEGEIVIVIGPAGGKSGRRIAEADALSHIAALSLCNEGTIRDWCAMPSSTSPRARISTVPVRSVPGSCPSPTRARLPTSGSRRGSMARCARAIAPAA